MRELVLSADPVLVSYVEALLRDAGVQVAILDRAVNALPGAIGAPPQRIVVAEGSWQEARRILVDAGLREWLVE